MKKLVLSVSAFMLTMNLMAQAPQKMSYQAVVRNSSNTLVQNGSVGMRISILQGSATGTAVYVETQTPTTNNNGLASVEIGAGTVVSGNMSMIDWSSDDYFIQTETDPTGGTNYTITGTSQLLSVPYALHAKTAESVINDMVDDADADPTNELQDWNTLPGIPSDFSDNVDDVDDADADPMNEIELPSGGNNAQVLSTDGSGSYSWVDQTVNNLPDGTSFGQTAYWDGTEWVVNDNLYNSGGNIGIGTSSPASILTVNGNVLIAGSTLPAGISMENTGGGEPIANFDVNFRAAGNTTTEKGGAVRIDTRSGYNTIQFLTRDGLGNDVEALSISETNNVGIGSSTPTQKLDVVGNVKFSGALMPNNTAGTSGQVLTSAGAGLAPTWTTPTSATNIYNTNGTLTGNRVVTQGTNTLGFTSTAVNAFNVDGTTFSVDAANNRVGIGTTTPQGVLAVGSSIATPLSWQPVATISDNNPEVLGLQGSVSGSNINFYKNGSTVRQAIIASSTNGSGADIGFRTTSSAGSVDIPRMIIKADGNVGIGTLTPARMLHVNDAMRLQPLAAAPASPSAGDMYFSSVTNKLMVFDGTVWQACW